MKGVSFFGGVGVKIKTLKSWNVIIPIQYIATSMQFFFFLRQTNIYEVDNGHAVSMWKKYSGHAVRKKIENLLCMQITIWKWEPLFTYDAKQYDLNMMHHIDIGSHNFGLVPKLFDLIVCWGVSYQKVVLSVHVMAFIWYVTH